MANSVSLFKTLFQEQFGDVIKQGASLLKKAVEGAADLEASQAQSGISKDNVTTTRTTSGEGKTTTETTSRKAITVDHVKQAEYLKKVVLPEIDRVADGLPKGELRIGNQTLTFEEIVAFVEKLFPARSRNQSNESKTDIPMSADSIKETYSKVVELKVEPKKEKPTVSREEQIKAAADTLGIPVAEAIDLILAKDWKVLEEKNAEEEKAEAEEVIKIANLISLDSNNLIRVGANKCFDRELKKVTDVDILNYRSLTEAAIKEYIIQLANKNGSVNNGTLFHLDNGILIEKIEAKIKENFTAAKEKAEINKLREQIIAEVGLGYAVQKDVENRPNLTSVIGIVLEDNAYRNNLTPEELVEKVGGYEALIKAILPEVKPAKSTETGHSAVSRFVDVGQTRI